MKIYGLRIALFILGFAAGVGFVWVSGSFAVGKVSDRSVVDNSRRENTTLTAEKRTGIEIRFKEFVETPDGMMADFAITNHDREFYVYSAYQPAIENEPLFSLPEVKLDGRKIVEFRCGTGLENKILKSGETRAFRYNLRHLSVFRKKEKTFQLGFYLKKENEKEFKDYWSESVPINEALEDYFLKLES